MLFLFLLIPKENQPYKKEVNSKGNARVALYLLPSLFHFLAPMYIVKNQYRMFIGVLQQLFKVIKGG